MSELVKKHCAACEGGVEKMYREHVDNMMSELNNWQLNESADIIFKDFKFDNYYETMAFVNAIAWMAHIENHHPDLEVGYNHCLVRYTTHALNGLSENDFICAAKVDAILAL